MGPGLDDYEAVPDDNPDRDVYAGSQDGITEDEVANEGEEEGEELFGDNYMRYATAGSLRLSLHAYTSVLTY